MDFFSFYGIPVSLIPDPAQVRKKYIENSRLYHPDFHTGQSPEEQTEFLNRATLNTEAYQVLSNRERLIPYVLQLSGLLAEGEKYTLPQSFLLDMMDINEALMELEFDEDPARAQDLQAGIATKHAALTEELDRTLKESGEAGADNKTVLQAVKDVWYRRKYLLRIQERLDTFASRK